ncbi:Alpha-amylase A type-1/2 [Pleodorina starrii]|nr:Alpha-amylase A type-1/2 [Pleodorina starrii]
MGLSTRQPAGVSRKSPWLPCSSHQQTLLQRACRTRAPTAAANSGRRSLLVRAEAPPPPPPPFLGASGAPEPAPIAGAKAASRTSPSAAVPAAHPGQGYSSAILLQGFAWDSYIHGKGDCVSKEGYMPSQLYDLTSKYGNEQQLRDLNTALTAAGITPMADIVINHRCADEQVRGVYNSYKDEIRHRGASIDWGRWAITSNDPRFQGTGNPDTGADYGPAPDLDHANPELRAALRDWLTWLQHDIGFGGWRFDYVRGFGAEFVAEYIDATSGPDSLNVGEYWTEAQWNGPHLSYDQNGPRQQLCDWINGTHQRCCAFDFPTKSILQEAVRNCEYDRLRDGQGKAPGLLGWWPGKAVTFVDNHDTGSTQQHWPFPAGRVGLGYAYVLSHPGIPCLFWDHVFGGGWGEGLHRDIASLAALRRRCGLEADSGISIAAAERDLYVARVEGRFGSLTLKLGPRFEMGSLLPAAADGWTLAAAGDDWAVWERPATNAAAAAAAASASAQRQDALEQ